MPLLALCVLGRVSKRTSDAEWSRPVKMTQTPWFASLVQKHQLQEWLVNRCDVKDRAAVSGQCECDILVEVGDGRAYDGPLTPWSEEENLLWEHLGRPHAARSLNIRRSVVLQRPMLVQRPSQLKVPIWSPSVPASSVEVRGVVPPGTGACLNAAGVCNALNISVQQLNQFLQAPICLAIPPILLKLIKKGAWNTVMLLAKWHQRRRGDAYHGFAQAFDLAAWHEVMKSSGLLERYVEPPALALSQMDATRLAMSLQGWAPHILAGNDTLDEQELSGIKLRLEEFVLKLQSFAGPVCLATHSRQKTFSHDTVVAALCSSMRLKNKKELAPMLREALNHMFPGLSADMNIRVPSGSTLSRRQLLVDAAFSCYWRNFFQEHTGPLYLWADSSPQGGVDWLLSIVSFAKQDSLADLVSAASFLQESTKHFEAACAIDDKDRMLEIARKRHECGVLVKSTLGLHRQIPMALGSAHTSLEHKVRCMCRKLYAESQSISALRQLLSRVRSMTTDMGTEMSIPDYEAAGLESVLPAFMLEPELLSEEDPLLHASADAAASSGHLLPEALLVPGILHVVNNMTKEIDGTLSFWDGFLPGFRAIAKLLHRTDLRQRLIAAIRETPYAWLESSFEKGVAAPAEWRWGTVTAIAPHILSLRSALRAIWHPSLFGHTQNEEDQGGGGREREPLQLDDITAAVRCKKWWLQLEVVYQLNHFGDEFSSWAEGCQCHGWLRPTASSAPHMRKQVVRSQEAEHLNAARHLLGLSASNGGDGFEFLCPLAGRRAPELACGAVSEHFRESIANQTNRIRQAGVDMEMDMEDIQEVLEDVSRATAAMQAYTAQKLQCWDVLPWKLCGVGHSNIAKSRQCAAACLELFRASPQQERLHHRVTWKYMREGCQTRAQLEAFIAGTPMCDLPELRVLVSELQFVPTVERIQEGDHSIVHRMVQYRQVSGPFVACSVRVPEIRSLMQIPVESSAFLSCFSEVESIDNIAKRFGFYKHPRWQQAIAEKQYKKKKIVLAGLMMYSMDIESQFSKMQSVKKAREKRARERDKVQKEWSLQFERKRKFSLEALQEVAMSDHLQEELQIGRLYSLPVGAAAISSLQSRLDPVHLRHERTQPALPAARPDEALALMSDVFEYPAVEADDVVMPSTPPAQPEHQSTQVRDSVFWKLTCAKPSKHKLMRLPAASAGRLSQHDFCVTLHRCLEIPGEGVRLVEIEPASSEGAGGFATEAVGVMSVFRADLSEVRDSMLQWSSRKDLSFTLATCEDILSRPMLNVLNDLVAAKAFPSTETRGQLVVGSADREKLQCLETLRQRGMVSMLLEEEGQSSYAFTSLGAQSLRHLRQCTAPARFFKSPSELADIPAVEWQYCTTWELLTLLQHSGWLLRQAPQPKDLKKRPLPPHTAEALADGNLVWYVRGLSLHNSKLYMLSLLRSKEFFEKSSLAELHHCQPIRYYEKVLEGSSDGTVALAHLSLEDKEAVPCLSLDVAEDFQSEQPAKAPPPVPRRRRLQEASETVAPEAGPARGDMTDGNKSQVQELLEMFEECSSQAHTSDEYQRSLALESLSQSDFYEPSFAGDGPGNPEPAFAAPSVLGESGDYYEAVEAMGDKLLAVGADPVVPAGSPASEPVVPAGSSASDPVLPAAGSSATDLALPAGSPALGVAGGAVPAASSDAPRLGAGASGSRTTEPDSFNWGHFRLTFVSAEKRPPYGLWQATCRFHRKNESTGCKKSMQLGSGPEAKETCKRMLMFWCLQAPKHRTKLGHSAVALSPSDALPLEVLNSRLSEMPAPPAVVQTDEQINAANRGPEPSTGAASDPESSSSSSSSSDSDSSSSSNIADGGKAMAHHDRGWWGGRSSDWWDQSGQSWSKEWQPRQWQRGGDGRGWQEWEQRDGRGGDGHGWQEWEQRDRRGGDGHGWQQWEQRDRRRWGGETHDNRAAAPSQGRGRGTSQKKAKGRGRWPKEGRYERRSQAAKKKREARGASRRRKAAGNVVAQADGEKSAGDAELAAPVAVEAAAKALAKASSSGEESSESEDCAEPEPSFGATLGHFWAIWGHLRIQSILFCGVKAGLCAWGAQIAQIPYSGLCTVLGQAARMMLQLDCEPTLSESRKAVEDTATGRLGPYQQHKQLEGRLAGATTAAESMSWPLEDLFSLEKQGAKYFGSNLAAAACERILEGVLLTTDYSGIGCPEEALHHVVTACKAFAAGLGKTVPEDAIFRCLRAGDVTMHCRQVLLKHAGTFRPMCVHGDIMERCPKKLLNRLAGYHKRAVSTAQTKVVAGKNKEGAIRQEVGRSTVRKISNFMLDVEKTSKASVLGMCAAHNRMCPVIPDIPVDFAGIRVHVAGVNCYDWSSMGSSKKWLGESMPIFMEWARERLLSLEDMIIVECVDAFDSDMLGELFHVSYNLEVLRISPTLFGEPVERQRKYMILLKKDKLAWTRHLSGQEKFRAPEHEVQEYKLGLAAQKHMPLCNEKGRQWSFFQVATKAIQKNISEHEKALAARIGSKADRSHWIVNVRQSPGFTPAKQFIVPALLRSSRLWLFGLKRWPLPLELLEVQGWNIWGRNPGVTEAIGNSQSSSGSQPETCPQEFRCEFVEALRSLPDKHLYSVAGNSMHLRVVGVQNLIQSLLLLSCIADSPASQQEVEATVDGVGCSHETEETDRAGDESDAQSSASASGHVNKKGRRSQKETSKKGPKVKKAAKKSKAKPGDSWRKCKQCNKFKEDSDYNEQQAKCKQCYNDNRSLARVAVRQNMKEDLEEMEKNDPKQHGALVKAFLKEREATKRGGKRLRFCIHTFTVKYKSQVGTRGEAEGEMMWEGEWLEEAQRAKHGFLSLQEARDMWAKWEKDEKHPRDREGPRNYLRLFVKTKDKIIQYNDISREKELAKGANLGKKPSQSVVDASMKMLAGDQGMEEHDLADFSAVLSKAKTSFAGNGQSSALAGDGLLGPDVEELLQGVKAKMAKKRTSDDMDDDTSEEAGSEKAKKGTGGNPSPNKSEKWFDAESRTRKAERMWEQQMTNLRREMDKVSGDMTAVLTEFRGSSDASKYSCEMLLVQKRQEWLDATLEPEEASLTSKVAKQQDCVQAVADTESAADSRDALAVAKAGPCAGWESLVTVSSLLAKATEFRACASDNDIKKHLESLVPAKKLLSTLMQACKAATGELLSARKKDQQNLEKRKEKELKDATAEKKRAAAVAGQGWVPVWGDEAVQMPMRTSWCEEWKGLDKPFVLTKCEDCFAHDDVSKAMKGFMAIFKESSMRITEGRAQAPASAEASQAFCKVLQAKVPKEIDGHAVVMGLESEQQQKQWPDLHKALLCSTFGVAASHVSVAKLELHLMPCLRATFHGTRFVTILLLNAVVELLQSQSKEDTLHRVQEFAFKCTEADVEKLKASGGAFCGTVGPNDILFTPGGALVSHRVLSQDIGGVRIGMLCGNMEPEMKKLAQLCPESRCIKQVQALFEATSLKASPPQDAKALEDAAAAFAASKGGSQQGPPQESKQDPQQ
ncbi:SHE10 [Symbiodinium sp. CCMP2456]|nr:SHE10 [Symbiodinium sp. CCMP2456]